MEEEEKSFGRTDTVFNDTFIEPRNVNIGTKRKKPVSITVFGIIGFAFLLAAVLLGVFVAPLFGLLSLGTVLSFGFAARKNNDFNYKELAFEEEKSPDICSGRSFEEVREKNNNNVVKNEEKKPLSNLHKKNSVSNDTILNDRIEDEENKKRTENDQGEVINEKPKTNKEKDNNAKEKGGELSDKI